MIQVVVGDNLITAQFDRADFSLTVGDEITLTHRPTACSAARF